MQRSGWRSRRNSLRSLISIGILAVVVQFGCTSPSPRRVNVPPPGQGADYGRVVQHEPMKPLPAESKRQPLPTGVEDRPLVSQRPPEQKSYVAAYEKVGRPVLLVRVQNASDAPVDATAIATLMTDLLAADGQATVLSPMLNTSSGPNADVTIEVRVEAIRRGEERAATEARMAADARNARGGESLGRAVVDVPLPLEKRPLQESTRYVARKLMDDLTQSWSRLADAPRATLPPPLPATAPAGQSAPDGPENIGAMPPPPPPVPPTQPSMRP